MLIFLILKLDVENFVSFCRFNRLNVFLPIKIDNKCWNLLEMLIFPRIWKFCWHIKLILICRHKSKIFCMLYFFCCKTKECVFFASCIALMAASTVTRLKIQDNLYQLLWYHFKTRRYWAFVSCTPPSYLVFLIVPNPLKAFLTNQIRFFSDLLPFSTCNFFLVFVPIQKNLF